jgi:hypothetical protein
MVPSNALVKAANTALANKDFRDSVRQMHAAGYPLVDMVEALGLDEEMTQRIRQILVELPDDVVAGIRQATLKMLDSGNFVMPLECSVTDPELAEGVPVAVEVGPERGVETIHVRPAPSAA